jgi:hypothetical protein
MNPSMNQALDCAEALPPFEIIGDQMAEILRRKTDAQRLRSVDAFWKSARSILRASILSTQPQWSISNGLKSPLSERRSMVQW